jgi:hypothetical protein
MQLWSVVKRCGSQPQTHLETKDKGSEPCEGVSDYVSK